MHSLAHLRLQDLILTLVGLCFLYLHMPAKVGINFYRFARERILFVYAWM